MRIGGRVEGLTRELLGHVVNGDQDRFETEIKRLDTATLEQAVALAMSVTGAVAVHVGQSNPPPDETLRTLAETARKTETDATLDAGDVHRYLAECIFGSATLLDVLPTHDAARLPFLVAGNLLASYAKQDEGQAWSGYLDQIEAALEASDPTPPS